MYGHNRVGNYVHRTSPKYKVFSTLLLLSILQPMLKMTFLSMTIIYTFLKSKSLKKIILFSEATWLNHNF